MAESKSNASATITKAPTDAEFHADKSANESGRVYSMSALTPRDRVVVAGEWEEHYDKSRNRAVKCSEVSEGPFFETKDNYYRIVRDMNFLIQHRGRQSDRAQGVSLEKCWIHENWRYSPARNHLQLWVLDEEKWADIGVVLRWGIEWNPIPTSVEQQPTAARR